MRALAHRGQPCARSTATAITTATSWLPTPVCQHSSLPHLHRTFTAHCRAGRLEARRRVRVWGVQCSSLQHQREGLSAYVCLPLFFSLHSFALATCNDGTPRIHSPTLSTQCSDGPTRWGCFSAIRSQYQNRISALAHGRFAHLHVRTPTRCGSLTYTLWSTSFTPIH
jgi:hypothetical protein